MPFIVIFSLLFSRLMRKNHAFPDTPGGPDNHMFVRNVTWLNHISN